MTPKQHAADLARMQMAAINDHVHQQAQAMHSHQGLAGQVLIASSPSPVWVTGTTTTGPLAGGVYAPQGVQSPQFWMKINGKDLLLPFPNQGQILYCEDGNPRWLYEHEIPRPVLPEPMFTLEELTES
jgi:hypothetical protein